MRAQLGWLTFLVAVGFATGLVLTLVGTTWFSISDENGLIGFFGFGVPMVAAGLGSATLWMDQKPLLKILGWMSTIIGLVCGVSLLVLVAGWVLSDDKSGQEPPGLKRDRERVTEWEAGNSGSPFDRLRNLHPHVKPPNIAHFLGFGVSMLACGGFGIAMLFASDEKAS